VKPVLDMLLTVPAVPPGLLTARALDPCPAPPLPPAPPPKGPRGCAELVLVLVVEDAAVELLDDPDVETSPIVIPPTATTAIPAVITMFRLREKKPRFPEGPCGGTGCSGIDKGSFDG
jgi:hypothetical protein